MGIPFIPGGPGFAITPPHTAFGTVIDGLIPPFLGSSGGPLIYGPTLVAAGAVPNPVPNWYQQPYSHITVLQYTTAGTAHTVTVMRPLNWSTFKTAVPKNTTAVGALTTDPGLYSTSYNYPMPGGNVPSQVADNALAANDYVAYQLDDGTWMFDIVASGTFAAVVLTTGTPNRTGATIAAGRPIFWFGVVGDSDPATGLAHLLFTTTASTNKINQIAGSNGEGISSLHPGDPMIVHTNNATATGIIDICAGDYRKF